MTTSTPRPEILEPACEWRAADVADEASWTVVLDVPGIPRADLTVELDGSRLVVSGSRAPEPKRGRTAVSERAFGRFEREFLIPAQVDHPNIRARLEHGVLTVSLPKATAADRRAVTID